MTPSDISTSFCQCSGSSFTERNVHDTSEIYWVYFKVLCKTRPESGDVCIRWILLLTLCCHASRRSCVSSLSLPLHVSAAITDNRNVHLWGDASERIFSGRYSPARLHSQDHLTKTARTHCNVVQMRWVHIICSTSILSDRNRVKRDSYSA